MTTSKQNSFAKKQVAGFTSLRFTGNHMGVNWFRQVVNGTENTGMIPPYGSNKRTDEDNIYGELKAA